MVDLANVAGSTVLSDFGQMQYDAAGNRTTVTATAPAAPPAYSGVTTYGYDLKNQLLQEQSSRTGGYSNVFAYDSGASPGAGNPTIFRGQGPNTFNANNQTTAVGFTYDGNGNPISYKGVSLAFDPENHLTSIGSALTAGYTAAGLRAFKQSAAGTTYFLYDGDQPVLEMDGSGSVTAVNTWGTSGLLSRYATSSNLSTFYTFDPQGNVTRRLDSSSNVLDTFAFDAYGARMGTDNPLDPYSGFEGQFGYYTDAETGLQLLTHRYYDSSTGQFINRDPIGYNGGINIYSYTANNPVNTSDPDGTDYFRDVGQVFAGYGDVLDPRNWVKGVAQISQIAGANGFRAAGNALVDGTYHGFTDWTTTSDPRAFGQSFGTVLITATSVGAPLARGVGLSRGINLTELKYTPKALSQFEKGAPGRIGAKGSPSDDFHGFPRIVDNYGRYAIVSKFRSSGDGLLRTRVRIPGGYKNATGFFEYIIRPLA